MFLLLLSLALIPFLLLAFIILLSSSLWVIYYCLEIQ
jgi:hypothetical protein